MRLWVVAVHGEDFGLATTVHTSEWDAWDTLRGNHTDLPFGAARGEVKDALDEQPQFHWTVDVHTV